MARRYEEVLEEHTREEAAGTGGAAAGGSLERIAETLLELNRENKAIQESSRANAERMETILDSADKSTRAAEELTVFLKNQQCAMQDAIHAGVGEAIGRLAADAQRRIEETERAAHAAIRAMEREARERADKAERIGRLWTLKNTLKTAILLLGILFMGWYAVTAIFFN